MAGPPTQCECGGRVVFDHTYEDWIDGDEDDIYRCVDCGKTITIYIPR